MNTPPFSFRSDLSPCRHHCARPYTSQSFQRSTEYPPCPGLLRTDPHFCASSLCIHLSLFLISISLYGTVGARIAIVSHLLSLPPYLGPLIASAALSLSTPMFMVYSSTVNKIVSKWRSPHALRPQNLRGNSFLSSRSIISSLTNKSTHPQNFVISPS